MVLETLAFSSLNNSTRLIGREDFVIQSRRESCKSYSLGSDGSEYEDDSLLGHCAA
jgi:hypothetical protein